ncbi:MAG: nucleotidyltransferase domain-containing protein [Candidatus Desantisbacteria bacterium]
MAIFVACKIHRILSSNRNSVALACGMCDHKIKANELIAEAITKTISQHLRQQEVLMIMIEQIREYFNKRQEVAFAFLFGSQANGQATSLSDIDIAIYFYPKHPKPIEVEMPVYYDQESKIWIELERILRKEVELVVLNRAPATISASAIRGTTIIIKDFRLYLDFMEVVTSEAIDFREMLINDFLRKAAA